MAPSLASPSPRRSFLQRLAAGSAAFLAGGWSPALAAPPAAPDDAWLARIRGKHRQVFDCTSPNDGFGPMFALTWLETTKDALHVGDDDITAVVSLRHLAMPLALNDEAWAKYRLGELLKVADAQTNAPAVRNVFHENILLHPGLSYKQLAADRRVVMTACGKALSVLSGMAGQRVGVSADQALREWTDAVIPGVTVVPSGVYAVHRAQQSGCTYCAGG